MKKLIFINFLVFATITGYGQKFKAAAVLGLTATQISGDELAGFDKPGIGAGALVNLPFNDKLSAQFELLYFQKGSKATSSDSLANYYYLNLHYAEVPLLLVYHLKKFQFDFGISTAFLLGFSEGNINGDFLQPRPFNTLDLSYCVGVSYPILPNLLMNWRFEDSILPVRDHASGATYLLNKGQYNTSLFFSFRYYFNTSNEENKTGN